MEKSEVEVVRKERFFEQYIYFVIAAMGFLLLEILLRYTLLRTFP
jgi:Ca-activated chloride channel homolog